MTTEQLQADPAPQDDSWSVIRRRAQQARQHRAGLLVGGLVHDLRNPLAVIQGFTELLLDAPRSKTDARDLERIHDEAARMSGLLDCVIEFLRLEAEAPVEVSLQRVVEMGLTLSHQLAKQHRVGVTAHPASSPAVVQGHLAPLAQVLLAALELAVERAGPGQVVSVGCGGLGAGRAGMVITHGVLAADHERAKAGFPTTAAECVDLPLCEQLLAGYGGTLRMADQPLLIVLDLPGC